MNPSAFERYTLEVQNDQKERVLRAKYGSDPYDAMFRCQIEDLKKRINPSVFTKHKGETSEDLQQAERSTNHG